MKKTKVYLVVLAMLSVWLALPVPAQASAKQASAKQVAVKKALSCSNPSTVTWDKAHDPYAGVEALPFYLHTDVWTQPNDGAESIKYCSLTDWKAIANFSGAAAERGVQSYPDIEYRWT